MPRNWTTSDYMSAPERRKRRRIDALRIMAKRKDSADALGKPEVILEFLFDRGMLSISVRNIGTRAAMKVAISFDRSFTGLGGAREISSLPLFKNVEFLGPAREIVTLLYDASYLRESSRRQSPRGVSYSREDRKY